MVLPISGDPNTTDVTDVFIFNTNTTSPTVSNVAPTKLAGTTEKSVTLNELVNISSIVTSNGSNNSQTQPAITTHEQSASTSNVKQLSTTIASTISESEVLTEATTITSINGTKHSISQITTKTTQTFTTSAHTTESALTITAPIKPLTPELTTTSLPTTTPEPTTTTPEPTTTSLPTTTPELTTTSLPTTTPEVPNTVTATIVTTEQLTTTLNVVDSTTTSPDDNVASTTTTTTIRQMQSELTTPSTTTATTTSTIDKTTQNTTKSPTTITTTTQQPMEITTLTQITTQSATTRLLNFTTLTNMKSRTRNKDAIVTPTTTPSIKVTVTATDISISTPRMTILHPTTQRGSADGFSPPSGPSKRSDTISIVVGVVGGLIFFVLLAILAVMLCKRRRRRVTKHGVYVYGAHDRPRPKTTARKFKTTENPEFCNKPFGRDLEKKSASRLDSNPPRRNEEFISKLNSQEIESPAHKSRTILTPKDLLKSRFVKVMHDEIGDVTNANSIPMKKISSATSGNAINTSNLPINESIAKSEPALNTPARPYHWQIEANVYEEVLPRYEYPDVIQPAGPNPLDIRRKPGPHQKRQGYVNLHAHKSYTTPYV